MLTTTKQWISEVRARHWLLPHRPYEPNRTVHVAAIEDANHQIRILDDDRIAWKHWTSSPSPHLLVHEETSDQSNWHSSPGAVTILVDAFGAAPNLGPLMEFRCRATVTYEPV